MEQTKSSISTLSGRFFDLLEPEDYEYCIDEIAEALSNICRYTGHVKKFYSVAEHSVLVSKLVPTRLALAALLHDSSEAFVGDVSSPLKKLLPEYQVIEERIQRAIANYYDVPFPFPKEIHEADKRMYWRERIDVAPGPRDTLWHQDLAATRKVQASGMKPLMAKRMFIHRFKEITSGSKGDKLLLTEGTKESKARESHRKGFALTKIQAA